jgi:anti-anti-sigma regulatory factor
VLDLSGLTYMGSSGLVAIHSIALLLEGHEPTSPEDGWQALHDLGSEAAAGHESALSLAAPPPSIERVLDRSGMLGLFKVYADRGSAVAAATTA